MVAFLNPRKANRLSIRALHVLRLIGSEPSLQISGTHLERCFYKSNDDLIDIAVNVVAHLRLCQPTEQRMPLQNETWSDNDYTCPNPKFLSAPLFLLKSPGNYSPRGKFLTSSKEKGAGGICSGHFLTHLRSWHMSMSLQGICDVWPLSEQLIQSFHPIRISSGLGN